MVTVGSDHSGQGGLGRVYGDRAGARRGGESNQFGGVGGEGNVGTEWLVIESLTRGAHGDRGAFASGGAPEADRLGEQVQRWQEHQGTALGGQRGQWCGQQ